LIKLLSYILFEKYICISALEMASPENQHCTNCIGTLSFLIIYKHDVMHKSEVGLHNILHCQAHKFMYTIFMHTDTLIITLRIHIGVEVKQLKWHKLAWESLKLFFSNLKMFLKLITVLILQCTRETAHHCELILNFTC